jgi:hypothetical protein
MKKMIQHPEICNEENVLYPKTHNEDSFKVLLRNYFCVTIFTVCHSFLDTNKATKDYEICAQPLEAQSAQH